MISTTIPEKLLLSANEAAKTLSICPRTLWSMTAPRGPIVALKIGARTLYPVDALRQWINAQVSTGEGRGEE